MLTSSFCHIPGVGTRMEERLWTLGYRSWHSVLDKRDRSIPRSVFDKIIRHIRKSIDELRDGNALFFAKRLPSDQHWRLFPEFRHSVAYLDIESTGPRAGIDHITTIAVYDGRGIHCYVRNRNLGRFARDIGRYKLLVTYNGKCFDIPFLEKSLEIRIHAAHIDLRYVLKSLGYMGGLKGCERQLGIDRGDLDGLDGYFAVLLWRDFVRHGNERALETLLAYNVEDVVNLEALMVEAYNRKLQHTPFLASRRSAPPAVPALPFRADRETIRRIRSAHVFRRPAAGRRGGR